VLQAPRTFFRVEPVVSRCPLLRIPRVPALGQMPVRRVNGISSRKPAYLHRRYAALNTALFLHAAGD
jgi:hypothetical protein